MIRSALLVALCWFQAASAAPPPKAVYQITGVAVSTRDGAPIPYCRMQIADSADVAVTQSQVRRGLGGFEPRVRRPEPTEVDADARGQFQFTLDHAGAYVLTGSARGFRRQNFDAHEGFFSSVVLTAAQPAINVTFRMERDASILGLVLDETGEPVRNAQVVAEIPGQAETEQPGRGPRRGGQGRQIGSAQTDDRGRYELTGLAPGGYRLRVSAQPWYAQGQRFGRTASAGPSLDPSLDVVYPVLWFPGVQDDAAAEVIRLSGGEERQADFHLAPMPAVHLVIPRADPPPAADEQPRPSRGAVLIRISPAGGNFNQSTLTNGTTQEFSGISPGLYELHTTGPDGRPNPEAKQFRVLPGSSGIIDLSTATSPTKVKLIYDGADARDVDQLTFVDTATGRVVSPDGGIFGFGRRQRGADQEDQQEHAVYLSPGKWQVRIADTSTTYLIGLKATGAVAIGPLVDITSEPASVTLLIGNGRGEVSGVATAAGKPVEGAMVLLVPAMLGDPSNAIEVQRDQTNTDGSFTLRGVVPGKYILLAIDHGWEVRWRDLPTLAHYLARGSPTEVLEHANLKKNVGVTEP